MPVKYKGILKIIFSIYTSCQQVHVMPVQNNDQRVHNYEVVEISWRVSASVKRLSVKLKGDVILTTIFK